MNHYNRVRSNCAAIDKLTMANSATVERLPSATLSIHVVTQPRANYATAPIVHAVNAARISVEYVSAARTHSPYTQLRPVTHLCRPTSSACDVPDYCDSVHGACPMDAHRVDNSVCYTAHDNSTKGVCYRGRCASRDAQCEHIWGEGMRAWTNGLIHHWMTQVHALPTYPVMNTST